MAPRPARGGSSSMSASPVPQRAQRVAKLTNKLDDDGRRTVQICKLDFK